MHRLVAVTQILKMKELDPGRHRMEEAITVAGTGNRVEELGKILCSLADAFGDFVDETDVGIAFGACFQRFGDDDLCIGYGIVGDVAVPHAHLDTFVVVLGHWIRCDDALFCFAFGFWSFRRLLSCLCLWLTLHLNWSL